ncbi:DUF1127 domain-containing protein [Granulosicoccus antarcticus]|uniref:DUF1127 domain-containing protein n=1 Tax=Granulosicoccus antarcticus IMCC3135 TaxID=1192854 RepID=A0A2Z2NK24_9GAMM|nr:DUF1127 domain-containing protein [Granulosicoccus antarcticus]ASJ71473.1 hypothetical protein IMCC3135_06830 [Granulosicoccus antarcticus IMCC3135]
MFKVFKNMAQGYERYMTLRGRILAREHLLRCDDRMLADSGFSRGLLQEGVSAWPWRTMEAQDASSYGNPALKSRAQAITDLKSLNDAELADLGITRGTIEQSVESGRAGVVADQRQKAA